MIPYLIKTIVCTALLLGIYLLFFQKEKMHRFNRLFLLFSLVFSFTAPLIPVTQNSIVPLILGSALIPADIIASPGNPDVQVDASTKPSVLPLLLFIYFLGSGLFLVRFLNNLRKIFLLAHRNRQIQYEGVRLVLLRQSTQTFSFLNYVFLEEEAYDSGLLEPEILLHECTHIREKHSWDV